jgi:putative transposase
MCARKEDMSGGCLPAMCRYASKKDTSTAGEKLLTSWVKKVIVDMQERIRAYKAELKLNNKQITGCTNHINAARFAWNWGLARRIEAYKEQGVTLNAISLHRELNSLKKTELSWLYDVSKCAPQEALRDLDKAYTNFFEHRARYPRFKTKKGKRSKQSFRLTGVIRVFTDSIQLPRLGILRLKEHNYLPSDEHILAATVSETAGHWFVSVQVKEDVEIPFNNGKIAGVDLGIKTMAYVSDGTTFESPKALKRHERKLKRAQRKVSRRIKGSNNRAKAIKELQRIHKRIQNIRTDAIHKATSHLAKTKSVIVLEDLNVKGMMKNHCLAKAIADVGLYEFRRQMEYKCPLYGAELIFADRFYPSSKMCSQCRHIKTDLTLSQRTYICDECGFTADRDHNASLNLRQVAVSSTDTLKTPDGAESSGLLNTGANETFLNETGSKHYLGTGVLNG